MTNKPKVEEWEKEIESILVRAHVCGQQHDYGAGLIILEKKLHKIIRSLLQEATQRAREEVIEEIEKELFVKEDEDAFSLVGRLIMFLRPLKSPPTPPLKEKGRR